MTRRVPQTGRLPVTGRCEECGETDDREGRSTLDLEFDGTPAHIVDDSASRRVRPESSTAGVSLAW